MWHYYILSIISILSFVYSKQTRIIGGKRASIEEFTGIVSIIAKKGNKHFCGGSIIDNRHVLSAAHCFQYKKDPSRFYVIAGDSNNQRRTASTRQQLFVNKIKVHSKFDRFALDYDFAILTLKKAAEWNSNVQPFRISSQRPTPGTKCHIAGWGLLKSELHVGSDVLMKAVVPIRSDKECLKNPDSINLKISFCAGFPSGAQDACNGDSGGPILCDNKIAGVVSYGFGCGEPNAYGVYADVAAVFDWIVQNANIESKGRSLLNSGGKTKNSRSGGVNRRFGPTEMLPLLLSLLKQILSISFEFKVFDF